MYKHKLIFVNCKDFEFESNERDVTPCWTGIQGSLFFFYQVYNKKTEELYKFPACNVVSIITKEIEQ